MKIRNFELFKVPPRWLFLKIVTDDNITGWGEPVIEGRAETVKTAVEELMEYLVNKDPLLIEDHWNVLYRGGFYRGGPVLMSAIAGIDQALWDIKGKFHGSPVHALMGGKVRDKVRVYSWIGGDRPDDLVEQAKKMREMGFSAVKFNAVNELQFVDSYSRIDEVVERVGSLRESLGNDFDIGIDFHGRVHRPMAKYMVKALEPYHPLFIEEPVLPENNEALREIKNHTSIPIATGERMFSRWHFRELFKEGLADIIQPDVSHAGGITECKKIASMAEAYDIALAPHCPLGPIALASCLQIDATCYNAFIQEQSIGIHYNQGNEVTDYIENPEVFRFAQGFVDIPSGQGLGIRINEDYVRKMSAIGHQWRNPLWRHKDGSVSEW